MDAALLAGGHVDEARLAVDALSDDDPRPARGLLSGSNALYLTAPADDQKRLHGVFAAPMASVIADAFAPSARTGRPIDPPLLLCLDEATKLLPCPPRRDRLHRAWAGSPAGVGVPRTSVRSS